MIELTIGGLLLLVVIFSSRRLLPRKRRVRGRELLSQRKANQIEKRERRLAPGRVVWGGKLLPLATETMHFLIVGTTGSGKTLTIKQLMRSVLPDVGAVPDQRALVYDSKQDALSFLSRFDCPVVTLNPFDARGAAWDMARDIVDPASALEVAGILVPQEQGTNRFFSDAARDLLCEVMKSFIVNASGCWTLRDLVCSMKSRNALWSVLCATYDGQCAFENYFAEERTAANILNAIRSRIAPLEPIAALWSNAERVVSLDEWASGNFILVLGNSERVRTALDALNRVIFKRATELVLDRAESSERRTWFFLDEVREAGKLDGLSSLMTKGRSKGACAVLGFQDTEGMKEAYGDHVANEIMAMCSNKAILRLESPETSAWAAKVMGETELIEVLNSVNLGRSWTERSKARNEQRVRSEAVMPSEFLSIPPTDKVNGLSGYYLSPYIGAYRSAVALESMIDEAPEESWMKLADFMPRSIEHQWMSKWEGEDFERLGIVMQTLGVVCAQGPARSRRNRKRGQVTISAGQ